MKWVILFLNTWKIWRTKKEAREKKKKKKEKKRKNQQKYLEATHAVCAQTAVNEKEGKSSTYTPFPNERVMFDDEKEYSYTKLSCDDPINSEFVVESMCRPIASATWMVPCELPLMLKISTPTDLSATKSSNWPFTTPTAVPRMSSEPKALNTPPDWRPAGSPFQ